MREIHADGMKVLTEAQVATLSGLATGSQVGRKELQDAADVLVRSGLFSKVNYNFSTHNDAVALTFHVEENPRLPVSYDNFPWYSDSELAEAVRKELPFYDGTLPEAGTVVDRAAEALKAFLAAHGATAGVEHLVLASVLTDSSIQQFRMVGLTPQIGSVDFSDSNLKESRAVQAHLPEIRGKAYSRMTIDIFLAEAIRPLYLQDGHLRAKIGPAEVRLSGNPNQKLPETIPLWIPCDPGPVYQWKGVEWKGNNALSSITLTSALGVKPGEAVNGMGVEAGWDRIRDDYGHLGYLEVKLAPVPTYDDQAHTVSYAVSVTDGPQYRFNTMIVTGLSLAAERMINEAWPVKPGDIFDKQLFEQLITNLESHRESVFKTLPIHYDTVGHWLQTDPAKGTVDALLDFK
ncbi:MAG TPA: POTRA domain-containing protein [Candidatus Acidoferrum sp.]